ncbi:putative receptor-like protein kinase [Morus notabilis]|uniref:Putative receptor-like protein kinase n=1 Tax=Morus notabilis TaxID=981085 RepID=W9RUG4_9ROSA|nr:putative receptor-like protein kinase [Morus notabilis]
MEMSGRVPLFFRFVAHLVVLIIILHKTSYAGHNKQNCPPSSCGNLNRISHPFRLTTDPQDCGDQRYELSCENSLPFLYLRMPYTHESRYYKYHVQAINYENSTIRVVDPDLRKDDCSSIPKISISKDDILFENKFETKIKYNRVAHGCWSLEFPLDYNLIETVLFLACEKPTNSSRLYNWIDRTPRVNNNSASSQSKRLYSYVVVNGNLSFSDLEESCRIDAVTLIRRGKNLNTSSYRGIHNELVYGFELSWLPGLEMESFIDGYIMTCYVDEDFNKVRCLTHCEILIPSRIMAAMLVISFLIYKWKSRHLSVYDGIEEFLQSYSDLIPVRYSSWDIRKMSGGFKDKLGEGGFGKGKDMEVADATEEESRTTKKMIIVALWCIQLKPCDRPSTNRVIEMLEVELESLQMPPKPYLYPQEEEQEKHNVEDAAEKSSSSTLS